MSGFHLQFGAIGTAHETWLQADRHHGELFEMAADDEGRRTLDAWQYLASSMEARSRALHPDRVDCEYWRMVSVRIWIIMKMVKEK